MLNLLRKQILTVKPDSSLCVSMYHKNAGCRRCQDICPVGAISIGRPGTGVAIYEDRCTGCGLCISECRQGVFKRSGTSEKNWCESAVSKSVKGVLEISCFMNPVKNTFQTECIGSTHVLYFLYWMLSGVKEIKLHLSCNECEISKGYACIQSQLNSLRDVCSDIKKCEIEIRYSDNIEIIVKRFPKISAKPEAVLTRRQLFSHFRREMIAGVANTADVFTDQNREAVDFSCKHPAERKRLSNEVFKFLGVEENKGLIDKNIPSGVMKIDDDKCRRCGLCAKLCPVGAIGIQENSFPQVMMKDCTGCGICEKICSSKAVFTDLVEQTAP
jgi:Na+-translocating ferredoxin:NAD+ oxidoreductase RNF subunit RnfB